MHSSSLCHCPSGDELLSCLLSISESRFSSGQSLLTGDSSRKMFTATTLLSRGPCHTPMDMSTFTLESVHSINSSTGTHHVVRLNRRTLSLSDSFYPLDPTRRAVVVHGWGRHLYRTISEVSFSRVVAEEVCAHLPLFYFLVFESGLSLLQSNEVDYTSRIIPPALLCNLHPGAYGPMTTLNLHGSKFPGVWVKESAALGKLSGGRGLACRSQAARLYSLNWMTMMSVQTCFFSHFSWTDGIFVYFNILASTCAEPEVLLTRIDSFWHTSGSESCEDSPRSCCTCVSLG